MKRVVLLVGAVVAVAGCATVSQMTATGGSRSDGIVRLSYEVGMFDKVQIDEVTALQTARQRCGTWGYTNAEAFGGITRQCQAYSASLGCTHWFVTKEYQCTSTAMAAPVAGLVGPVDAPVSQAPVMAGGTPGTIDLGGGVQLVPSKTASGYCIKAPSGYMGSGSVNRPAVTEAKPRCS